MEDQSSNRRRRVKNKKKGRRPSILLWTFFILHTPHTNLFHSHSIFVLSLPPVFDCAFVCLLACLLASHRFPKSFPVIGSVVVEAVYTLSIIELLLILSAGHQLSASSAVGQCIL
jgi:hypothetical protein